MSLPKGFVTAGENEHITYYGASRAYPLSLHDLLQEALARHPGVPLTAFKLGVYTQREPKAHGCCVTGRDERSFIGVELVKTEKGDSST